MQSYRAFLLRCWPAQAKSAETPTAWRFSLEEVGPERHPLGFVSLEALVNYLNAELNEGQEICASQARDRAATDDSVPPDETLT
ncbi:MAG: hypothetical protein U0822_20070 [Anaerolineae bacterium]